ncbi:NAD-dependent deacylase [Marinibactrum halimedae]|uniref:NAD-dependent protein deacylase n=1 Tax=Marinibactrum halimedae TaxID=1444977 RepID=A0AA37WQB9_9GAMM|nr:NAD-dependent deacylase [Marinibactrum halimedae]MCD9459800.1 NAD-dependent deacylase [Marinibactrum halimedae]GLS27007.1 NAD-dependent protein deacylase [Marinibactrum halimedae]
MNRKEINPKKIVVFTGAGISAESGLKTFRDSDGLWENYPIELVATPEGWWNDPELVLGFYNQRRSDAAQAKPNAAHQAIARLEEQYEVVIITQNIDDLHERAGSTQVLHLHGELTKARSSIEESLLYDIGSKPIHLGQKCELNSQLRPHVVWFGEIPLYMEEAQAHFQEASRVLVVGTSLVVEPAASLVKRARYQAEKVIVTLEVDKVPYGYQLLRAKATSMVPTICDGWLN